ncbi:MAG: hypothetical protein NC299_17745 [Lachnospiraceae bacterium]|nr:hypothetical protein [Lachnospiraceae bacterium]
MTSKLTVTMENADKLKSAVNNVENKLAELREAIDELENINLEVQIK